MFSAKSFFFHCICTTFCVTPVCIWNLLVVLHRNTVKNVQLDKWANREVIFNNIYKHTQYTHVEVSVCAPLKLMRMCFEARKRPIHFNPQAAIIVSLVHVHVTFRMNNYDRMLYDTLMGLRCMAAINDDIHRCVLTQVLRIHWLREYSSVSIAHCILSCTRFGQVIIAIDVETWHNCRTVHTEKLKYFCLDFLPTVMFVSLFLHLHLRPVLMWPIEANTQNHTTSTLYFELGGIFVYACTVFEFSEFQRTNRNFHRNRIDIEPSLTICSYLCQFCTFSTNHTKSHRKIE